MIKPFIKEIVNPAEIPASGTWEVQLNGIKLSEALPAQFVPVVSVSALNNSAANMKVILNESSDNSFRVPASGSRSLTGIPVWNISIENLDTATAIAVGDAVVTLVNDFEQVARYNAFSKGRGF